MDKETNVQRVLNMVFRICGCTNDEAEEVLEESLQRVRDKME